MLTVFWCSAKAAALALHNSMEKRRKSNEEKRTIAPSRQQVYGNELVPDRYQTEDNRPTATGMPAPRVVEYSFME